MRYISKLTKFLKPVKLKYIHSTLKACSKTIKEGDTVKDVIKSKLKPTVGAVLNSTVDQVASKLIEMQKHQNDKPLPNPFIMLFELKQAGLGIKRRSRTVCKKIPKRNKYLSNQQPIIYNCLKWQPLEVM